MFMFLGEVGNLRALLRSMQGRSDGRYCSCRIEHTQGNWKGYLGSCFHPPPTTCQRNQLCTADVSTPVNLGINLLGIAANG